MSKYWLMGRVFPAWLRVYDTATSRSIRIIMALLFDFFPVLLFFLAYKWYGIFVATAVIIVATLAQVGIQWARSRTVKPMHLVTAVIVLVFGGITLLVGDEEWIKWKVTVVNWLFA